MGSGLVQGVPQGVPLGPLMECIEYMDDIIVVCDSNSLAEAHEVVLEATRRSAAERAAIPDPDRNDEAQGADARISAGTARAQGQGRAMGVDHDNEERCVE